MTKALLDLRQQPKTFLEGDWDKVIKNHCDKCREANRKEIYCYINEKNKEDFINLLDILKLEHEFIGTSEIINDSLAYVPANGELYKIKL